MFLSHIFEFLKEKSSSRISTNVITFVIQAFTRFIALFLLTSCIVFSERNSFENTFEERTFPNRNASAQAGSMSTTVQSDDDRPVFVFEERKIGLSRVPGGGSVGDPGSSLCHLLPFPHTAKP